MKKRKPLCAAKGKGGINGMGINGKCMSTQVVNGKGRTAEKERPPPLLTFPHLLGEEHDHVCVGREEGHTHTNTHTQNWPEISLIQTQNFYICVSVVCVWHYHQFESFLLFNEKEWTQKCKWKIQKSISTSPFIIIFPHYHHIRNIIEGRNAR